MASDCPECCFQRALPEPSARAKPIAEIPVPDRARGNAIHESICDNPFMCGRYRLSRRKQLVEEYFGTDSGEHDWNPRYNIAPSQPVPTIRQDARELVRRFSIMRWGLIPSWSKDPSIGYKTINARSETVANAPSFREPFKSQRCLIPADGFYEWQRSGKSKQPYCFEVNDGELFAFAGLWDRWTNPQGGPIESCTIDDHQILSWPTSTTGCR